MRVITAASRRSWGARHRADRTLGTGRARCSPSASCSPGSWPYLAPGARRRERQYVDGAASPGAPPRPAVGHAAQRRRRSSSGTVVFSAAITIEAGLSFIGPACSRHSGWGIMLAGAGREQPAPVLSVPPGAAILLRCCRSMCSATSCRDWSSVTNGRVKAPCSTRRRPPFRRARRGPRAPDRKVRRSTSTARHLLPRPRRRRLMAVSDVSLHVGVARCSPWWARRLRQELARLGIAACSPPAGLSARSVRLG
jgi:hypothetical protein